MSRDNFSLSIFHKKVTRSDNGLLGVTGSYKGVRGGYRGLKKTWFLSRTSPRTFCKSICINGCKGLPGVTRGYLGL